MYCSWSKDPSHIDVEMYTSVAVFIFKAQQDQKLSGNRTGLFLKILFIKIKFGFHLEINGPKPGGTKERD